MNPPPVGADLPLQFGAARADPDGAALSAGATDAEWPTEPLHDAAAAVSTPRLLTPAVLRVLEWHRARSTARH